MSSKVQNRKAKNAGVGIDFKRAKHKVGKKLKPAQNATNTDFKSRAINMPGQNIGEDKGAAAVSGRNLTLKELLGQLGHYSGKNRAAALAGLTDLLQRHPQELNRQAGPIVEALAERVADPEAPVRDALHALLAAHVLPGLGPAAVAPFAPLLMAHVCGAMTSLAPDVRSDALRFLVAVVAAAPEQAAAGFMAPVLQHYVALLSSATWARSVASRSLASLLQVLTSLNDFLAATSAHKEVGGKPSLAGQQDAGVHSADEKVLLFRHRCCWVPERLAPHLQTPLAAGPRGCGAGRIIKPPSGARLQRRVQDSESLGPAEALLDRLLEAWGECGPMHLSQDGDVTAVRAMAAVLGCVRPLLAALPLQYAPEWRAKVAGRVAATVPARSPVTRSDPALSAALADLNVAAATLLASFLPHLQADAAMVRGAGVAPWVHRLLDFCIGLLDRGCVLPGQDEDEEDGSTVRSQPRVSAAAYSAILEGVLAALPWLAPQDVVRMLGAVDLLLKRSPPRSAAAAACLQFQAQILAQPGRFLCPHGGHAPIVDERTAAFWLMALPKLLWSQAAPAGHKTSRLVLRMLHDSARYARRGGAVSRTLDELQPQLAPLFSADITGAMKKGGGNPAAKKGGREVLLGPVFKLPQELQELAVDTLFFLAPPQEPLLASLALACHDSRVPSHTAMRLVDVLLKRPDPPAVLLSLLLRLLAAPYVGGSWERQTEIIACLCQRVSALGTTGEAPLLRGLEDGLLRRLEDRTVFAAYGVVRLCTAALAGRSDPDVLLPPQLAERMLDALAWLSVQVTGDASPLGSFAAGADGQAFGLCLELLAAAPHYAKAFLEALQQIVQSNEDTDPVAAGLQLAARFLQSQELQSVVLELQQPFVQLVTVLRDMVMAKQSVHARQDLGAALNTLEHCMRDVFAAT